MKFLLLALPLAALALIAAAKPTASATAVQIATAIMIGAPLVMPLLLKYVPLTGPKMLLFTVGVSIAVAVAAGYASGLFTNLNSIPGLVAAGTAVFGLTQVVYQLFKDNKTFSKYVT